MQNVSTPLDEEIMVFTASKSLGLAGTRFGYGFIKDKQIA